MSDLRFAVLTSVILVLGYLVALSVTSLERVLAYVGSIGSTSISFILPGLFYYKISDPESIHHQRLLKEDDDAGDAVDADDDIEDSAALATSIQSLGSVASVALDPRKWRKKWRWDLEHIEHDALRKGALLLSIYGLCVMVICLAMNIVFHASG
jgi:amino acid permease